MLPDCIDATDFRYIKVDNKYIMSLNINTLPDKICFLDVISFIDKNIQYDMSIKCEKLNINKVINDITYNIANIQSELNTISKNQKNIDVMSRANQDAQNLRRKIQLENQELYSINIIFTFYSDNLIQLQNIISNFKSKFYSRSIKSDITNFKHLDFFLYNLPLNLKNDFNNKIYITTDALANIFPFYTNSLTDIKGILFGSSIKDNNLCFIDLFSNKYENSNMCIFGLSGSGKSYFTKLLICRNFFCDREQIILDYEGEYENLCKSLGGNVIDQNSYYNILQITKKDIEEKDFLDKKIERILGCFTFICNTEDIDIGKLKQALKDIYLKFNISNNIESVLYSQENNMMHLDSRILSKDKFPTLEDLRDSVEDEKLKRFLEINIQGKLKFFSKITTFEPNENLYVISVNKLPYKNETLWIILNGLLNRYLGDRETLIYIDEAWKYINNHILSESMLNLYKIIRKRKGAVVSITQDLTDLFKYNDGLYAKGILNNSTFKMIFKTEYKDEEAFGQLTHTEHKDYSNLKKGEAYLLMNKNSIHLKISANKFERDVINENDNSY